MTRQIARKWASALTLAALVIFSSASCASPARPTPEPTIAPIVTSPGTGVPIFQGATQVYTVSGGDETTYVATVSPATGGSAVQQAKTIVLTAGTTNGTFNLTITSGGKSTTVTFTVINQRTNSVTFVSSDPAPGNTPTNVVAFVVNYTTAEDGMKMAIWFYDTNGKLVVSSNQNRPSLGASGQIYNQAAAAPGTTEFVDFIIYREGGGDGQHFRFQMHYVWK